MKRGISNVLHCIAIVIVVALLTKPVYVFALGICMHMSVTSTTITDIEYSNNAGSYCYSNIEYITYHCTTCNATWTTKNNLCSIPHQWNEVIDSFDDTYIYYYFVCQTCGCKKYSRKVLHNGYLPWSSNDAIEF